MAGRLVWGLHRDTADILAIGLPVFSLGSIATGPLEVAPRHSQSTLRQQVDFASFLEIRSRNARLTFREHLRAVGGAIEE